MASQIKGGLLLMQLISVLAQNFVSAQLRLRVLINVKAPPIIIENAEQRLEVNFRRLYIATYGHPLRYVRVALFRQALEFYRKEIIEKTGLFKLESFLVYDNFNKLKSPDIDFEKSPDEEMARFYSELQSAIDQRKYKKALEIVSVLLADARSEIEGMIWLYLDDLS